MRPLSFTKNLGGFHKAYDALRRGYSPGVTVEQFRTRSGLNSDLSLLVAEFFLFTQVRGGREYVVEDTLIAQTFTRSFDLTLARLYFFAINLAMPGERLRPEQQEAGRLQKHLLTRHVYVRDGWLDARFDKDSSLEPFVRRVAGGFPSVRKWVNNYFWMKEQCQFVRRPDGTVETFGDTWGPLALRLYFDRYAMYHPTDDVGAFVQAANDAELHRLIGVPRVWLDERVEGAADMFLKEEFYVFDMPLESNAERNAAGTGAALPAPEEGTEASRRLVMIKQLIRRGENRRFIQSAYSGACQLSGVVLKLPGDKFTVDCAHIRPLGAPHKGPDDVSNMLSLSPTMHRLLDRGCIRIDPTSLSITLLHGNGVPHLPKLLVRPEHNVSRNHLRYYQTHLAGR